MALTIGVWYHRENCFSISLLNKSYQAFPFSTDEHNLDVSSKMEATQVGILEAHQNLKVVSHVLQVFPGVNFIILESRHIQQPQALLTNRNTYKCDLLTLVFLLCFFFQNMHISCNGRQTHPHSSTGEKLLPPQILLVQVKRLICIYIAIQGLQP